MVDGIAPRYWAFISYSHTNSATARWLHRALESFRMPRDLVRDGVPSRLFPVFLDREELSSSSHLSSAIVDALERSRCLIVMCSPQAAASLWVNEEIRKFRVRGASDRILCVIVSGDPSAQAGQPNACFPPALFESGGKEPVAADLRKGGDGRSGALRKLVAGILNVPLAELTQRELQRQRRRSAAIVAVALAVSALTTTLAITAVAARNAAREQALRAESIRGFLVSMFREQDPLGRGAPQARNPEELIEHAVRQLDAGAHADLSVAPDLRDELLHELGQILLSLGNPTAARALLERAVSGRFEQLGADSLELASSKTVLAKALNRQGRHEEARALGEDAVRILSAAPAADPVEWAQAELTLANALSFGRSAPPEAEALFRAAIARLEAAKGHNSIETLQAIWHLAQMHSQARADAEAVPLLRDLIERAGHVYGAGSVIAAYAYSDLGRIHTRAGQVDEAIGEHERALAALLEAGIEKGSMVAASRNSLAIALRTAGRLESALPHFDAAEKALDGMEDSSRPDLLRGRGRVLLELGRPQEAEADMRKAYELRLATSGEADGLTWYMASEWGRALTALKRYPEAEALQRKAVLKIEQIMGPEAHQNALVLDALTQTLLARGGAREEAIELQRKALAITARRYPPGTSLWSQYAGALASGLLDSTRAQDRDEAGRLIETALSEIRARAVPVLPHLAEALELQARLLERQGKATLARAAKTEAEDVRAQMRAPAGSPG